MNKKRKQSPPHIFDSSSTRNVYLLNEWHHTDNNDNDWSKTEK